MFDINKAAMAQTTKLQPLFYLNKADVSNFLLSSVYTKSLPLFP